MNKTVFSSILIIILIVGGYFFIDFNFLYNKYFKTQIEYISQNKNCDLHKSACEITSKDTQKFTLEVFPKEIPLMKPLTFKLTTSKEYDNLSLNIYSTNMFMGEFDLKFKKIGQNSYEAQGTLPTCSVGNMKWNADLKTTKKDGVRFTFKTDI